MIIDLCTTNVCNFGCKYCSEGHFSEELIKERSLTGKSKVPVQTLVNLFKEYGDTKNKIAFWGGEPMLNFEYCKEVIQALRNDAGFSFMFYTNGYYLCKNPGILDYLVELNDSLKQDTSIYGNEPRLFVQVSYDGEIVNDKLRVTKSGKSTSEFCLKSLKMLRDAGIDTAFKSTITGDTFKYIDKAFVDVIKTSNTRYFPTPDLTADFSESELSDLKQGLMRCAAYIVKNQLDPRLFGWFGFDKSKCGAGNEYFAIDIDGNISTCHSAMYGNQSDFKISNIFELDCAKKLHEASKRFKKYLNYNNTKCRNCKNVFCMRCNYFNYLKNSHICDYEERWNSINENSCKIWDINNIVFNSMNKAINTIQDYGKDNAKYSD